MASNGFIELLRLADRGIKRKKGKLLANASQWQGVAFKLGGYHLVAPLGEVSEVLTLPELTPVPLSKSWISGIANVRGRVLPVTNLVSFLKLEQTQQRASEYKVLVVDKPKIFAGLQVEQVMGIYTFSQKQYEAVGLANDVLLSAYIHGRFRQNQQEWYIFMPSLLTEDSRFLEAGLS